MAMAVVFGFEFSIASKKRSDNHIKDLGNQPSEISQIEIFKRDSIQYLMRLILLSSDSATSLTSG
jgi:hypothetical protein